MPGIRTPLGVDYLCGGFHPGEQSFAFYQDGRRGRGATLPAGQLPPSQQPEQRFDVQPDHWSQWSGYNYVARAGLPSGQYPATRQRSQRIESLPDLFQQWDCYTQPPQAAWYLPPPPPDRRRPQRQDPLPDLWQWQPFSYVMRAGLPEGDFPRSRQPGQHHQQAPEHWPYGQVRTLPANLPAGVFPLPRGRIQNRDPLPETSGQWWDCYTQPAFVQQFVPPLPFFRQPSQRWDVLPDLFQQAHQVRPPLPEGDHPPTRQPSQRWDALPDVNGQWWVGADERPTASWFVPPLPPSRQQSQRWDALPDHWQVQDFQYSYTTGLPAGVRPTTKQPSQRWDTLPDDSRQWWEQYPTFSQWFVPPRPPSRQPSQRFDPLPDLWQWQDFQYSNTTTVPAGVRPPSRQAGQRWDALPDLHDYWQVDARVTSFPPPPPPRAASQRWDALPDLWLSEPHRQKANASWYVPQSPPTKQPSQRWDSLPDLFQQWDCYAQPTFSQWFVPPAPPTRQRSQRIESLPDYWQVQEFVYSYATTVPAGVRPQPRRPAQHYEPAPDLWAAWDQYVTPSSLLPAGQRPSTRQPSQRVEALPDPNGQWWEGQSQPPQAGWYVPPAPPTRQSSQRWDAPAEFWATPDAYVRRKSGQFFPTLPAPRQPSQRWDAAPDLWQVQEFQYAFSATATTGVPPLPRQPSQRWDAAPDLWQVQDFQYSYTTTVPAGVKPPTRQPGQRHDPLPDEARQWWEQYPTFSQWYVPDSPLSRQSSQRHDLPPELWEQYQTAHRPIAQFAKDGPTVRQPSQRWDSLPEQAGTWQTYARALPPSSLPAGVRPLPQQADQHIESLPDYWQVQPFRYSYLSSRQDGFPPPTRQQGQRWDEQPDYWQQWTAYCRPFLPRLYQLYRVMAGLRWTGPTNMDLAWVGNRTVLTGVIGVVKYRQPVRANTPQVIGPYTFRDNRGQIINLNSYVGAALLVKRVGLDDVTLPAGILLPTQNGQVIANDVYTFTTDGTWSVQFYLVDVAGRHYYGDILEVKVVPNTDDLATNEVPVY